MAEEALIPKITGVEVQLPVFEISEVQGGTTQFVTVITVSLVKLPQVAVTTEVTV
jgi:hypothetical protein